MRHIYFTQLKIKFFQHNAKDSHSDSDFFFHKRVDTNFTFNTFQTTYDITYGLFPVPTHVFYIFNQTFHCLHCNIFIKTIFFQMLLQCLQLFTHKSAICHTESSHKIQVKDSSHKIQLTYQFHGYIYVSLQLHVQNQRRQWHFPLNF